MTKKAFILFIILVGISTLFKCVSNKKDKIGVMGFVEDNMGNPLGDVTISYKSDLISVQTDSLGNYTIDTPRTFFIQFKKEGYQTLATKIDDFSEEGSYNFKSVVLKKKNTKEVEYKDVYLNTKPKQHSLKLSGNVTTIFNTPIKNTKVTLIDSIVTLEDSIKHTVTSENHKSNRGFFFFRKYENKFSFEKRGFRNLQIELDTYEKDNLKIRLLEESNRNGIYLIESGKYLPLPKTKLLYKTESKEGVYLGVFAGRYEISALFYPNNTKQYKIKKDTLIRFAIFNPNKNKLCKVKDTSRYLCTVNYKYAPSFTKGNFVKEKTIYPSELCINCNDEPLIVELKPDTVGGNYVFVNATTKKGYYFTY